MSGFNILATKLFIPPVPDELIPRTSLVQRIEEGVNGKLIFVIAPAGFGKSSVLSAWARQARVPVCWLSLDSSDNDPVVLLSYLIASVQTIFPQLGDEILGALNSPDQSPIDPLLTAWINELSEHTSEFALIVDDFHCVTDAGAIELFQKLLAYQAPQMRLILASRSDPPFSASRWRVGSDLLYVGIDDLRFSPAEAAQLLRRHFDQINDEDIEMLTERTEGWVAGLKMAVLSLQTGAYKKPDISSFGAQDRYVTDYLMDEVLHHQPAEVQRFLLRTSLLGSMTARLCNDLMGDEHSQAMIEYLETSGLFIIALDNTRTWYRYHHLFAELLQHRLFNSTSDDIHKLHQQASNWYLKEGMLEEAIEHAFNSEEYPFVLDQLEAGLNQMLVHGMFRKYLAWMQRIPQSWLAQRPLLEIVRIFVFHETGRKDQVEAQLAYVEKLLGPLPEDLGQLDLTSAYCRGVLAAIKSIFYSGSVVLEKTVVYADLAETLLPEDDLFWRPLVLGARAFVYRTMGNFEQAIERFSEVLALNMRAGFIFQAFMIISVLSKLHLQNGNLKLAILTCQKALDLDASQDYNTPFAGGAYLLMAGLLYRAGQLERAEKYVEKGLGHVVRHREVFSTISGYYLLILIQIQLGEETQARALLNEMKVTLQGMNLNSNANKVLRAFEASILIALNQLETIADWCSNPQADQFEGEYYFDLGSTRYTGVYRVPQDPIEYMCNSVRIIQVRCMLAGQDHQAAIRLLTMLLSDLDRQGWVDQRIEVLLLLSIARANTAATSEAEADFCEALDLAVRGGFVQIFCEAGEEILGFLVTARKFSEGDLEKELFILQLIERIEMQAEIKRQLRGKEMDSLTAREIEVLQCLEQGISFARARFIACNKPFTPSLP